MTRNSSKLRRKPQENYKPPENNQSQQVNTAKSENPFGLSFVTPTEKVKLPSEGKFYKSSSPLYAMSEVEIKHMTAREEDLLSQVSGDDDQSIYDKLINGILINEGISAEDFLEEDKVALLLKSRETGYGKEYRATTYCEACDNTTEFVFDLSKTTINKADDSLIFDADSGCFVTTLPISKVEVKLQRLSDSDLNAIEKEKTKKEGLKIEFNKTLSTLSKMIVSANDVEDASMIVKFLEVMPAADAKFILNFDKTALPTLSTRQIVECSECGAASEKEAPLSWAFFRTEF